MIHHKYVKNKNENTGSKPEVYWQDSVDVTEQIILIQHQCNVRHTSNDSKRKYKQGDYHSINTKF